MAKCFIAVAIVEVERLWFRFHQLGCNEEGILTAEIFRDPVIAQDVFMKNVISFLTSWTREREISRIIQCKTHGTVTYYFLVS